MITAEWIESVISGEGTPASKAREITRKFLNEPFYYEKPGDEAGYMNVWNPETKEWNRRFYVQVGAKVVRDN